MLSDYMSIPTPQGGRNHALYCAALQGREEGYSESELTAMLTAKATADGLDAAEIHATLCSAFSKPLTTPDPDRMAWHSTIGARKEYLAWNATISAEKCGLPPIPHTPQPRQDWQTRDAVDYLNALYQNDDIVSYNVKFTRDKDGVCRPAGRGIYVRHVADLLEDLGKGTTAERLHVDPACGAWVRLNPTDGKGIHDRNVVDFRYALVEADGPPIETQWHVINKLRLPCATVVHSGGKSLHAAVRIDAGNDAAEYARRVAKLYGVLEAHGLKIDTQNKNPSRLSRLPGVPRGTGKQYLVARNIGLPSWAEWIKHIDEAADGVPLPESWAELRLNPPPLSPEIIHGILRRGHKLLLGGPSKAGKSYALIQLAAAVCAGTDWFGHRCEPGNVLYVNLEIDRASFVHRVAAVEKYVPFTPERLSVWNLRGHNMTLLKLKERLRAIVQGKSFDLIALDPIYKMNAGGDENSAKDMIQFCNFIEDIAELTGAAVCFVHHFSKGEQGAKASIDRASGSGVFGRDPDAIGTLSRLEGEDHGGNGYKLEWTLREFRSPAPASWVWDWPIHRPAPELQDRKVAGCVGRPSSISVSDILEVLDNTDDHRLTAIADIMGKHKNTVRNAIERGTTLVIENGIIRKVTCVH